MKPYKDPSALAAISERGVGTQYDVDLIWYGWLDEKHVWMKFNPYAPQRGPGARTLRSLVVWDLTAEVDLIVDLDKEFPTNCLGQCIKQLQAWGWEVPWAEGGET